jgi:hypothetical protein
MLSNILLENCYCRKSYEEEDNLNVHSSKNSRLQAKRLSKIFFSQPVMWNHRLINVGMDLWKYQVNKKLLSISTPLYNFIYGQGIISDINNLIEKIKFSEVINSNKEIIQYIEHVAIKYIGYSTINKNYIITYSNIHYFGKNPKYIEDKLKIAKMILFIMNEVHPEEINYTNYGNLVHWLISNLKPTLNIENIFFGPIIS